MSEFVEAHDFQEFFTVEEASARILGMGTRFHGPEVFAPIANRMRGDAAKGLLTINQGQIQREEIARWLRETGLPSEYKFGRSSVSTLSSTDADTGADLDPSDLPTELQAANIAFRAVKNGHGRQSDTFRNRLVGFLEKNFNDLSPEAIQRIATVANPDKTTGRKKRDEK